MGFALIYKSTGVVNFAQGELVDADRLYRLQPRQCARPCPSCRCSRHHPDRDGARVSRSSGIFIRPMLGEPTFAIVMVTRRARGDPAQRHDPHLGLRAAQLSTPGCRPKVVTLFGVPFYPAQLALLAALRAGASCAVWLFLQLQPLRRGDARDRRERDGGVAGRASASTAFMRSPGCCPPPSRPIAGPAVRHQLQARAGHVVPGTEILSRRHPRRHGFGRRRRARRPDHRR